MSDDQVFVVAPFRKRNGKLQPVSMDRVQDAATAVQKARVAASRHVGAGAYKLRLDTFTNEAFDLVEIAKFGDVPAVETIM